MISYFASGVDISTMGEDGYFRNSVSDSIDIFYRETRILKKECFHQDST